MYSVAKRDGLWWVLDADGFEVSYVGYDFKYQALEAAKIRAAEDNDSIEADGGVSTP